MSCVQNLLLGIEVLQCRVENVIEKVAGACKWRALNSNLRIRTLFCVRTSFNAEPLKVLNIKAWLKGVLENSSDCQLEEEVRELKIIKGVLSQGMDVMDALQP